MQKWYIDSFEPFSEINDTLISKYILTDTAFNVDISPLFLRSHDFAYLSLDQKFSNLPINLDSISFKGIKLLSNYSSGDFVLDDNLQDTDELLNVIQSSDQGIFHSNLCNSSYFNLILYFKLKFSETTPVRVYCMDERIYKTNYIISTKKVNNYMFDKLSTKPNISCPVESHCGVYFLIDEKVFSQVLLALSNDRKGKANSFNDCNWMVNDQRTNNNLFVSDNNLYINNTSKEKIKKELLEVFSYKNHSAVDDLSRIVFNEDYSHRHELDNYIFYKNIDIETEDNGISFGRREIKFNRLIKKDDKKYILMCYREQGAIYNSIIKNKFLI